MYVNILVSCNVLPTTVENDYFGIELGFVWRKWSIVNSPKYRRHGVEHNFVYKHLVSS
jgi:hypothetical protein